MRKEGIDRLSMDRVAQQAGLSKGAVMYHFPSKRSLQAALLEDYAEHMDEELHRHEALFEGTSIEKLMAGYIEWFRSFARDNHGWSAVGVQLLGQQALDPELIKPVSDWYNRLYAKFDKLPPKQRAKFLTALMALEGLFFVHKFGVGELGSERTREILKTIAETTSVADFVASAQIDEKEVSGKASDEKNRNEDGESASPAAKATQSDD